MLSKNMMGVEPMNIEDQIMELNKIIAGCEKEHQDFKRRLDNHAEELRNLRNIFVTLEEQGNAIERMGRSLDRVEKKVDNMDGRVESLEREPGEKWKKVSWEILKYALLAVAGVIIGKFL
jgi:predicted RNase H-like nuclease (RuvC/YqgF family)